MAEGSHAILMVDDDVELCALVAEYLGGHGYDVATVHDGADAACVRPSTVVTIS